MLTKTDKDIRRAARILVRIRQELARSDVPNPAQRSRCITAIACAQAELGTAMDAARQFGDAPR